MVKYLDFILEKMISESIFQYSDKFQKIISRINLPISRSLIDIKGKDITTSQNYIDVVLDEDDMVTFISDAKAIEIMGKKEILFRITELERYLINSPKNKPVFDKLGIDIDGDYFAEPMGDETGKVLGEAIGTNGTYVLFEYVTPHEVSGKKIVLNKVCIEPFDSIDFSRLWTSNRNKIKIGRFVRSILKANGVSFSDKDVESFVNAYRSEIELLNNAFIKFDIVDGDAIPDFYDYRKYAILSGTLGNSCMRSKPKEFFDLYSKNPDRVKMAILYGDNGKVIDGKYSSDFITGRALVWKSDQGDTIMDRIYTIHDKDVELFKKFAEKNNWWCKKIQNSEIEFISQRGEETKVEEYTISLSNVIFDKYPFVDTFECMDLDGSKISNIPRKPFLWSMGNTDGRISKHR